MRQAAISSLPCGRYRMQQHLGSGVIYHTLIPDKFNPRPVCVKSHCRDVIHFTADRMISGTADYPQQGCTMTLAGKEVDTAGPLSVALHRRVNLIPGAWNDVKQFMNAVQHETWTLSPTGDASTLHASGRLCGRQSRRRARMPLGIGKLIPYSDKDRAALVQTLLAGAQIQGDDPADG